MKSKIISSLFGLFVVGIAIWATNQCLRDNKVTDVLLANLEAVAQNEGSVGGKAGYVDNSEDCVIKEAYECVIDMTVPDWVPYIGGTKCSVSYIDEVEFPGTKNDCIYTGNMNQSCDYYRCQKN